MKIIHLQGGAVRIVEEAEFLDHSLAVPRVQQKMKGVAAFYARNPDFMEKLKGRGNGYRPGPFLSLAADQCRFTLETGEMCGAICHHGRRSRSWCSAHYDVVYGRTR